MVSSLVEPQETLQAPVPFILSDERWFPLRAIAEAFGAKVIYVKDSPADADADSYTFAVHVEADWVEPIILNINDVSIAASQGAFSRQLPVLVRDDRIFVTGRFFEQFLQLKYTCYTSVVVFEMSD